MAYDGQGESYMDELHDLCRIKYVKSFIIWSFWNIARYIIVGLLISEANHKNAHALSTDEYQLNCCSCYQQSIHDDTRYDLSYCIPSCTDCNYCKTHAGDDPFSQCPYPEYSNSHSSIFNLDWYKATGCDLKKQSITSMTYFVKSYKVYGNIALSLTISYAAFNFLLILLTCFCMSDMGFTFFRWSWIYNVGMTEVCLYLMLKPFQYKNIYDGFCQIDSISDFYEEVLTKTIMISLILVAFHLLWVFGWIIYYIVKCVKSWKHDHRGRLVSISLIHNRQIQDGMMAGYIKLSSDKDNYRKFTCLWGFVGIFAFMIMLFFLLLVILIAVKSLNPENEKNEKLLHKEWIYTVYVLLMFSLVDNPWIWSKCITFQKCISFE